MGIFSNTNKNRTPHVDSILPQAAVNEIIAGRLPILNTDNIFLKNGEFCCYIDKAILEEKKIKKMYEHVGSSAPFLLKGTRINFGTGIPHEYTDYQHYNAILYITNKRIILHCKDHGFDKAFGYLSAAKPFSNALDLQFGSKTYTIFLPNGALAYRAIQLVQQGRK